MPLMNRKLSLCSLNSNLNSDFGLGMIVASVMNYFFYRQQLSGAKRLSPRGARTKAGALVLVIWNQGGLYPRPDNSL